MKIEEQTTPISAYEIYTPKLYVFFALMAVYTAICCWTLYDLGYNNARAELSQPSKYRCYEQTVYRSTQGYWENTGQKCRSIEEIK